MKKIFLSVFVILLTALSTNATTIVSYGPGGVPLTAQTGYRKVSVDGDYYGFSRNALAAPQNIERQRVNRITREIRRRNSLAGCPYNRRMYQPSVVVTPQIYTQPSVSRFDKNYRITAPRSTYTRNGITYYN